MKPSRTFCPGCNKLFANKPAYMNHAKNDKSCSPEARFWGRVNKNGANGCWLFLGCLDGWGYGDTQYRGKHLQAHRLAWILLRGEPGELDVLHKCNTPPCCNPDHLYLGTDLENAQDRIKAGTHWSKLTPEHVREIRARFQGVTGKKARGDLQRELAAKFGVNTASIWCVRKGTKWKHVR